MTLDNLIALLTLTALEIVLGIDNIVFIAILVSKIPQKDQKWVRQLGLFLAMFMRIGLLFGITWVMHLTTPLLTVLQKSFSGRDLILVLGGLFLIGKATHEIHERQKGAGHEEAKAKAQKKLSLVIIQIILLDIIFSLDSVITAVGMVSQLWIMITAVVIAVGIMMTFSGMISRFIQKHPTLKTLALSFLILVGAMLFMEGLGEHIETLNIRAEGRSKPKASNS
jgi:predicted tellurium resistance membrane protein TerC